MLISENNCSLINAKMHCRPGEIQWLQLLSLEEFDKGFIQGPFEKLFFPYYRVSPIGIAVHKYSLKKRLILDLSLPHNTSDHESVNDMIDKEQCSLSYIKLDDAIQVIQEFDRSSIFCMHSNSYLYLLVSGMYFSSYGTIIILFYFLLVVVPVPNCLIE